MKIPIPISITHAIVTLELGHTKGDEQPRYATEEDCKPDEIKREGHGKVSFPDEMGVG